MNPPSIPLPDGGIVPSSSLLAAMLLACLSVPASAGEITEPAPSSEADRPKILQSLEVPDFVPPVPTPPKTPPPDMRVRETVLRPTAHGRSLRIIRGSASSQPDLPPPDPLLVEAEPQRPLTSQEIADRNEQRHRSLVFGATVHDHRVSHVNWHHPDTGEAYEAICGFDAGLLAGIGEFECEGKAHSLLLVHSHVAAGERRATLAAIPTGMVFVTRGDPEDAVGMRPLTLLRDLIVSERERLEIYQGQRLRYEAAQRQWKEQHPEPPRDETVWLRPHRGSRYLANGEGGER